jgi:hypothetical protein
VDNMKKQIYFNSILAMIALLMVFGTADLYGQRRTVKKRPVIRKATVARRAAVSSRLFAVDRGTIIRVRMNGSLSSRTARVGQRFTTTVTEPVYSTTGVVVVPTGSTVTCRVDSARPAAKSGKPGQMDVSFVEVRMPNGTRRAINGTLTDLVSDDAKSDVEGTASGDRMKHRKIIFIGGGGAGGAVLGGAIGGGKGALIGGLLGAGAGYLGQKLTKGEEADVRSGTEFGVYLNQAISLPRFAEVNP